MLAVGLFPLGDQAGPLAQVMGEKAEMDRLELKAEEAIANGDPSGATLAIGRAALMASILEKNERHPQNQLIYQAAEELFRTQENAYRALALFEQAGGQLPAPSGVCQLLSLSEQHGTNARGKLSPVTLETNSEAQELYDRLLDKHQDWIQIIEDLQADFSCR